MASSRTPSWFLLAAKRAEVEEFSRLTTSCQLVGDVAALVHELQRERGMTNVFLASQGERFAAQRLEQVQCCIRIAQRFRDRLATLEKPVLSVSASARLFHRLAWVLQGLEGMASVRQRILAQDIQAAEATQIFCGMIAGLLAVVFEVAELVTDTDVTCLLVALFNFMQGKEYAGQERAWAAAGFAAKHFSVAQRALLSELRQNQQRCFDVFAEFSSPEQAGYWQQLEGNEETREEIQAFLRLRKMIEGSADTALPAEISEVWYALASRRIDRMQVMECELLAALRALSKQKRLLVENQLRDQHRLPQTMREPTPPEPVSILLATLRADGDALEARSVNPLLPRSLYDLLAEQSADLRRVSDELAQARRALAERKTLERAKGLLMKHRGLSDELAWHQLQKMSMNSGRPLREVAERLIALLQIKP